MNYISDAPHAVRSCHDLILLPQSTIIQFCYTMCRFNVINTMIQLHIKYSIFQHLFSHLIHIYCILLILTVQLFVIIHKYCIWWCHAFHAMTNKVVGNTSVVVTVTIMLSSNKLDSATVANAVGDAVTVVLVKFHELLP